MPSNFDQLLKNNQNQAVQTGPTAPVTNPTPSVAHPLPSVQPPSATGKPVAVSPLISSVSSGVIKDARPVLRRDPNSVWKRAELSLQRLYLAARKAVDDLGVQALVCRTNRFEFPPKVSFECWLPSAADPMVTERTWANIVLEVKPFHSLEIVYHVGTGDRGREDSWGQFGTIRDVDVADIIKHLVVGTSKPRLLTPIKTPGMSFWTALFGGYKTNELDAVSSDYLGLIAGWGLFAGIGLTAAGLFLTPPLLAAGVPLLLLCGAGLWWLGRQPLVVRSAGRADQEPRRLSHYDSWQVVLFGGGASASVLKQRLQLALTQSQVPGFCFEIENIQYITPDGLDEREQWVASSRRGIIYCQIYEFGKDLYIGWQSFLNLGSWKEEVIASGKDKVTGQRVSVRTAVASAHVATEYDYMDLNCLTEWVHAQFTAFTRQLMSELKLDQEIDFKIVRGTRQSNQPQSTADPNSAPTETQTPAPASGGLSLFKRRA